ncbi:MAG: helix-turn-helix transcriptional regulator [Gemmatimonadetes bacterium]|nr:helix-turn-helix transcriptional regulator [Gemmatimonadota bacterium]
MHGKTRPGTSSTERIEAKLFVVTSASPLDLTEEPLELDFLGKLDNARQKEEHPETPDNSGNSRNFRKTWMESFLNTNYSNPYLCFDDVRREFRFSPSYGCRLFREYFGKTFREKLREIRIARAERLICETTMYMKEIAAECGFRSSKRLCEAFVRIHGISPVEYRNRYFKKDLPGAPRE